MYRNVSVSELLPEPYSACLSVPPVSRASAGEPVPPTTTASLKTTLTSITLPALYAPSGVPEVTFSTPTPIVSILMGSAPASESGPPGAGSVRLAPLPAASVMAPPSPSVSADLLA